MAIQINLEKYGHKKKGYLSFSWTSLFFNFLVPLFRLDIKWFFIFIYYDFFHNRFKLVFYFNIISFCSISNFYSFT